MSWFGFGLFGFLSRNIGLRGIFCCRGLSVREGVLQQRVVWSCVRVVEIVLCQKRLSCKRHMLFRLFLRCGQRIKSSEPSASSQSLCTSTVVIILIIVICIIFSIVISIDISIRIVGILF